VVAAHDLDPADTDPEMVGDELADGDIGLVLDWSGRHAHYETAGSIAIHLVSASPRDHPYLETLGLCTHGLRP
jgi:hypothetical protein